MASWMQFFRDSLWIGIMYLACTPAGAVESFVPEQMPTQPLVSEGAKKTASKSTSKNQKEYTLLPRIRVEAGGDTQSKGIYIEDLKGTFRFGLFTSEPCFLKLPRVTYAQDAHILSADRDLIYSTKVEGNVGDVVALYRTGKRYFDPKTKEFLGYLAFKSAEAQIIEKQNTKRENNVVMQVLHNLEPIDKTMRIGKNEWPPLLSQHYLKPVLVDRLIEGYIVGLWDPGITLIGPNTSVVLSVGTREGASVGNLLEIYRSKDLLDSSINKKIKEKDRPEIRVGRVLVYQVSEKLSLGLVTEIYEKVRVYDKIRGEVLSADADPCEAQTLDAHFFDNTCHGVDDCIEKGPERKEVIENIYEKGPNRVGIQSDYEK